MIFHRKNVAMKQEVKTSRKNEPRTTNHVPRGYFFLITQKHPRGDVSACDFLMRGR